MFLPSTTPELIIHVDRMDDSCIMDKINTFAEDRLNNKWDVKRCTVTDLKRVFHVV